MRLNRVVITGVGAVSPYGQGADALRDGIRSGIGCVRVMEQWRTIKGLSSFLAAPAPAFDFKKLLPRAERRTMGDMAAYATLAAREATRDAGLSPQMLGSGEIGVSLGSTTGSPLIYQDLYEQFLRGQSIENITSGMFFKIMGHSCAANVMHALGIRGEQWAPTSACTSSAQAIGLGYLLVRAGRQRAVFCGGADEVHHSVTMFFDVLRAASHKNETPRNTPAPFDAGRDGVVCGCGCGVLVLESLDSALSRGARIHAEITGFGNTGDPDHIANPRVEGMLAAMRQALAEARIEPREVDYLNAHATGTEQGDRAEAEAIAGLFGDRPPVSSLKGHMGHTLGAAGALESIAALDMLRRNEIVPTLNLETIDPECGRCNLIQEKTNKNIDVILKNSFALGGVYTAIVYKRY